MKLEIADDTLLIRLIADAQTDAINELYGRYNRLVFSVAFAILGDRALAEETTLDVFVRVWQRAGTYRAERAKVSTWVIAITRHHAIDILRRQRTHPQLDGMHLDGIAWQENPAVHDLEEEAEMAIQKNRVRQAFAQLPAEQREALVLAYFGGYTHAEIANALKQPLGTIKTRIRLGMLKLRQILKEE